MPAPVRRRRIPLDERLKRVARDQQIVEMRDANVPVAVIAKNLGVVESTVRKALRRRYESAVDAATGAVQYRRAERERQLEHLDLRVSRLLSVDPRDPAALSAAGLDVRDWIAAVETSRRLKLDMCRLFGLGTGTGPQPAEQPASAINPAGDPVAEARVVMRWLDGIRETNPKLYDLALTELLPTPQPVAGDGVGDGDGEGGTDE